jgi:hypothetical protein
MLNPTRSATTLKSSSADVNIAEDKALFARLQEHQRKAGKLSLADEVRTLLHSNNGYGVLTTFSQQFLGFPTGSVVAFHIDEDNKPFFGFSNLSGQTKDLLVDGRACLVVSAAGFKGLQDARVSIVGTVTPVKDTALIPVLRERYLKKHPGSYWVDFGYVIITNFCKLIILTSIASFIL